VLWHDLDYLARHSPESLMLAERNFSESGARAQVPAPVIESVSVYMVSPKRVINSEAKYQAVHRNPPALPIYPYSASCIVGLIVFAPFGAPMPLR